MDSILKFVFGLIIIVGGTPIVWFLLRKGYRYLKKTITDDLIDNVAEKHNKQLRGGK